MGGGRREVKHRKKEGTNTKKGETDGEEEEKKGSYGG